MRGIDEVLERSKDKTMNDIKKQIKALVGERIDALVTSTLDSVFGINTQRFDAVQLVDYRETNGALQFVQKMLGNTEYVRRLGLLLETQIMSDHNFNKAIAHYNQHFLNKWPGGLKAEFYDLGWKEREVIDGVMKRLGTQRANKDFKEALEKAEEKSAQNSETSGKSQI